MILGMKYGCFLPERPLYRQHMHGTRTLGEKLRNRLGSITLDRLVLTRPKLAAATQFNPHRRLNVDLFGTELMVYTPGIAKQDGLAVSRIHL